MGLLGRTRLGALACVTLAIAMLGALVSVIDLASTLHPSSAAIAAGATVSNAHAQNHSAIVRCTASDIEAGMNLPRTAHAGFTWRMVSPGSNTSDNGSERRRKETAQKLVCALRRLGEDSVLIDVGVRDGWFTLLAAHAGHRVYSFEAYEPRLGVIHASVCAAPGPVRRRIRLLSYTLGPTVLDGHRCEVWQGAGVGVAGAVHTVCLGTGKRTYANAVRKLKASRFEQAGTVQVRALDALLHDGDLLIPPKSSVILRVDVDGWEPMVLGGGKRFLRKVRPQVVIATFAPEALWQTALTMGLSTRQARFSSARFLTFMKQQGYTYKLGQGDVQDLVFVRDSK